MQTIFTGKAGTLKFHRTIYLSGKHLADVLLITFMCMLLLVSCSPNSGKEQLVVHPAMRTALSTAEVMSDANNPKGALEFLRKRMERIPDLSIADKFEYLNYAQITYSQSSIRNNEMALRYADSMLNLLVRTGTDVAMPKAVARALFSRGDAYFEAGMIQEAFQSYFKARKQSVDGNDLCTEADFNYRIGMVLFKQRQFKAAAATFQTALNLSANCATEFTQFMRHQEVLDNIGLSFARSGNYDSASAWYAKAIAYLDQEGPVYSQRKSLVASAKGVILGNWGDAYRLSGNNLKAGELLRQSIAINDRAGYDQRDAAFSKLTLARVYLSEGRIQDVLALLDEVKSQGHVAANREAMTTWNELAWRTQEAQGNVPAALSYLKAYDVLKTETLDNLLASREQQVREQLERLDAQRELSAAYRTTSYQRMLLVGGSVLFFLCLLFAILVYRYWVKSKQHVEVLTDLHGAIRLQKSQLEQAMVQLEDESRDKDRILRMVVHDLRNPIASVAALADLLHQQAYDTPEERDEFLELIEQACGNSLNLINEILVATRGNSRQSVEMVPTDVVAIVKSSADLLQFKAAEKNQMIRLRIPDSEIILPANGERLWRVVNNLITNAIKFSPENKPIDVTLDELANGMQITVRDYGIGIPEQMQSIVFEMFTEAKRPGTANEKSFGLGLSISKQIVEEHGGNISVQSKEGEGSMFYVFLPYESPSAASLAGAMKGDSVYA